MKFGVAANFLEAPGQKRAQSVHGRFVVAGRFDFHQLADGFGDGVFSLSEETQPVREIRGARTGMLRLLKDLFHKELWSRLV